MERARLPAVLTVVLLVFVLAVIVSCANVRTRNQSSEEKVLVRVTKPCPFTIVDDGRVAEVDWSYPVVPRVWYPGDGPLGAHPYNYYAVRCWPGCHDPNSAPRPQHY
jgi:hypothetical protein